MKKFISQITAFALVICMLAALVPAIPASAADGDLVFDFYVEELESQTLWLTDANFTDYNGRNWKYHAGDYTSATMKGAIADAAANGYHLFKHGNGKKGLYLNLKSGNSALTFDITVEKGGWYTLSGVDAFSYDGSMGKTTVYIINRTNNTIDKAGVFDLTGVTADANAVPVKDAAISEVQQVFLNVGENKLRLFGSTDPNMVALQKITFSPVVEEEADIALDFDLHGEISAREEVIALIGDRTPADYAMVADANINEHGWQISSDSNLTDSTLYWRLTDVSDSWNFANYRFYDNFGARLTFYNDIRNDIAINFNVDEAGYYTLDGTIYALPGYGQSVEMFIHSGNGASIPVGGFDIASGDTWTQVTMPEAKTVYLTEGINSIRLKGASNEIIAVNKIEFTKVGDAVANTDAVFGNIFAYVKNTESGTTVSFVGGIKTIEDFEEVGFDVDGTEYTTKNVYEKLTTSDGATLTAADFGAEGGYIFHTAPIAVDAGDVVAIQAIAKGIENATGRTVSVTIK